jgi:DNA-binding winged helix-turn-helix (wHTH) protein
MQSHQRASGSDICAFGPYTFDLSRRVLLRDDAAVAVSYKALELLRMLVLRSGELVTKDEIIKAVWNGEPVSDANLTQHIAMLRRALNERPHDRQYIATVPGAGYRFVAPVRLG